MLAVIGFALVGKVRADEYTKGVRLDAARTAPAPRAAVLTVLLPMTPVIVGAAYQGAIGWRAFVALSVIMVAFGRVVYSAAAKRHQEHDMPSSR